MTTRQIITLVALVSIMAPLHWLGIKWLSERHSFCTESTFIPGEGAYTRTECGYPEQTLSLEKGVTKTIAVCRCKR